MIVASALRFATQLLNVSVPQAIGWSQIEVSLAIILACAPMCVKVLLAPLVDPHEIETPHGSSKFMGRSTSLLGRLKSRESGYVQYGQKERTQADINPSSFAERQLAARQGSFSVPTMRFHDARSSTEQLPSDYSKRYSGVSVESSVAISEDVRTPGDISIPDYRRLRVVRAEVNGQSNWEVSNDSSMALGVGFKAYSSSQVRPVSSEPFSELGPRPI